MSLSIGHITLRNKKHLKRNFGLGLVGVCGGEGNTTPQKRLCAWEANFREDQLILAYNDKHEGLITVGKPVHLTLDH